MAMEMDVVLPQKAINLAKRYSADELHERVRVEYAKLIQIGRRAVRQTIKLGTELLALWDKTRYGGFEDRLESLGIAKTTAYRFMKLAAHADLIEAALNQAPSLTQEMCEKVIAEHRGDEAQRRIISMSDDVPWEQLAQRSIEAVQRKRATRGGEMTAAKVMAALKRALQDAQDLVLTVPESPEAHGVAGYLAQYAEELRIAHERALNRAVRGKDVA